MEIDIQTLNFIFNIELNEFKNKVTSDLELRNKIKNVQKNICHPQNPIYGSKFIASLNDFELIKLIKALTLFDSINSLGSVSPVSFLLNEYRFRVPENYDELLNWVFVENDGRNPWLATGSALYDVTSIEQYHEFLKIKNDKVVLRQLESKLRQEDKINRLRLKANKDIWNAIKRKDLKAIQVFLDRGADLNAKNSEGITIKEIITRLGFIDL